MLKPEHLKIETIGGSPKGCQQSGRLPVGVRVTHVPTGLVASCGCDRSQCNNREIAMAMLDTGVAILENSRIGV